MRAPENDNTKSRIWHRVAPYVYCCLMAAGIVAATVITRRSPLPVNFPWGLSSLLVVAIAAVNWGLGPSTFVLILLGISADLLVPDLHIPAHDHHAAHIVMPAMRILLFVACGAAMIFLAHTSKRMARRSEQKADVVRAFQAMMLPQTMPTVPGYSIECRYKPAREEEEVGGDFYDVFSLDEGRALAVVIGDVTGKGKEAAASIALLRYGIRAYITMGLPPDEAVARTNAMMCDDPYVQANATLFVGVLDTTTGRIAYCNAGHEPPIVASKDQSYRFLDGTSIMLGVFRDSRYEAFTGRIAAGESLLLLTDGVTEARNTPGAFLEAEGAARLFVRSAVSARARDTAERFDHALRGFAPGPQRDDIAFVVLSRRRRAQERTEAVLAREG